MGNEYIQIAEEFETMDEPDQKALGNDANRVGEEFNMFFKLVDGVFFQTGAKFAALYDCTSGDVFWLDENARAVVGGVTYDPEFWQELEELGLAEGCEIFTALPALPKGSTPKLGFVWLEIMSDDCNEQCLQCYADSMPKTKRKQLLPVQLEENPKRELTFEEWRALIQESFNLGARACQFIGGEPTLYHTNDGDWLDLCSWAREVGFEFIEVYTNATMLTEAKVLKIKELNLSIAVSLYSNDPQIHDAITQTPGSHKKTLANLELLKKHGVETRVEIVMMKPNQETVPQTIELIQDMGFRNRGADPLRPKGRGDKITLFPSLEATAYYGIRLDAGGFRANQEIIAHYSTSHSCISGKITITQHGKILTCIFADRDNPSAIVFLPDGSVSLELALSSTALQSKWSATKDGVAVCKDCEYRSVCFDCIELNAINGGLAPYRCSYNPYTGEWAEGLWRLDGNGDPFYDRSHAEVLRRVARQKG